MRILSDLITTYAQFKTKEELQNDFGIILNFLDYARLIRSIPTTWEALRHEWHLTDIKPWCQPFCQVLLCDTKTTQLIKKVFKESNNYQPTAIASWQREITIPTSPTFWDKIFILPFRVGFDHWSKMFQYKILHRILPTNSKLFQYNIKDSELCDFCLIDRESILHIFCECDIATSIWDSVVEWYNSFGYNLDYLSDAQIVFGDPSFDPIFNRIILITKIEIFNSKSKNRRVLLGAIIQRLKYQFQIEKFIATKNGRLKTFRVFWSPIYLYMKDNLWYFHWCLSWGCCYTTKCNARKWYLHMICLFYIQLLSIFVCPDIHVILIKNRRPSQMDWLHQNFEKRIATRLQWKRDDYYCVIFEIYTWHGNGDTRT